MVVSKDNCDPCLDGLVDWFWCAVPGDPDSPCLKGVIKLYIKESLPIVLSGTIPSDLWQRAALDAGNACIYGLISTANRPLGFAACGIKSVCKTLLCAELLDGGGTVMGTSKTLCEWFRDPLGKFFGWKPANASIVVPNSLVNGSNPVTGEYNPWNWNSLGYATDDNGHVILPYGGTIGQSVTTYLDWFQRMMTILDAYFYVYGDYGWILKGDGDAVVSVLTSYHDAITPESDGSTRITDQEQQTLLSVAAAHYIAAENVTHIIERWNRTFDYWSQGIFETADVPSDQSTDFIDAAVWLSKCEAAEAVQQEAVTAGYEDVAEAFNAAGAALSTAVSAVPSTNGICATVKLQIDQQAVITRDAFEATLEFDNNTNEVVQNVDVDILITDSDGRDVTSLFGIHDPTLDGFYGENATLGHVGGQNTGTAKWLMVPTTDCSISGPTTYYVGGTLSYYDHGLLVRRSLTAVPIVVYPQPELALDYFMQRNVYGDDPWTEEVEPSQPFELAVMVNNFGAGAATDLTITSSQPVIVDNQRGLLVDFKIIATEVAGQNVTPTLTADFGQLDSGEIKIAQWWMASTIQGHFIDYNASFRHLDGMGNPRLSLIKSVKIHELIHTVDAGADQNPAVCTPDFLVNDIADIHSDPDTLYLSDGSVEDVHVVKVGTFDGAVSIGDLNVQLTVDLQQGWNYVRLADSSAGTFNLQQVNLGAARLESKNFWQTDRTFIGGGQRPVMEDVVHMLVCADKTGTFMYNLSYKSSDQQAPKLENVGTPPEITNRTVDGIILEFDEPVDPSGMDVTLLRRMKWCCQLISYEPRRQRLPTRQS